MINRALKEESLHKELSEWYATQSDVETDKLHKIALKLQDPAQEEKLRRKIEKYLNKRSGYFSDCNEESFEFRRQLPDHIINKLKAMYLKFQPSSESIKQASKPKYHTQFKAEKLKKYVLNWIKRLDIKKTDFLGRAVAKEDVFNFVINKLEPIVLLRPKSDLKYKHVLRTSINDIIANIPISYDGQNKDDYLTTITDSILNDILRIETEIPVRYIQPTIAEVKRFAKDELTNFFAKTHTTVSMKTMKCLEAELTEHLLDARSAEDIDNFVVTDVINVLKDIAKLPEDKVKYFTKILVTDYKEFFFRQNYFKTSKDLFSAGDKDNNPTVSISDKHMNNTPTDKFKTYVDIMTNEIYKWFCNLPIDDYNKEVTVINKRSMLRLAKNLANHLIDNKIERIDKDIDNWITCMFNGFICNNRVQQLKNRLKAACSENNNISGDNNDSKYEIQDKIATKKYETIIDEWLDTISLDFEAEDTFNDRRNEFTHGLTSCLYNINRIFERSTQKTVLKDEILQWMKKLPIDKLADDEKYKEKYAEKLARKIRKCDALVAGEDETKYPVDNNFGDDLQNRQLAMHVSDVIRNWVARLPLKTKHDSKDVKLLIVEMSVVITSLLNQTYNDYTQINERKIKEEVSRFLKRFPLYPGSISEPHVVDATADLTNILKDMRLNLDDVSKTGIFTNKTAYSGKQKTNVYEFSVTNGFNDSKPLSMKEDDVSSKLNAYTKEIVKQINEWWADIKLVQTRDEGFREVVMNDLAADIVDRYEYLELNPDRRGTPEEELEHLKYQIFKWVSKIVDKSIDPTKYADALMRRVKSLPAPRISRPQDSRQGGPSNGFSTSNNLNSTAQENISALLQDSTINLSPKQRIYDEYQHIFGVQVEELPIDSSTPESARLAKLAKTAIYNGILKTFFTLTSNSEYDNDDGYFELLFEEKLDKMLDILPQTEEIKSFRHRWKVDVLNNATNMLRELQSVSDRPSFKQRLKEGFNRKYIKNFELEKCFLMQQGFLVEMAEAFILATKYKEENPIKANIYRQRLMKKIDELGNHLAKQHDTEFKYLKKPQLVQHAMKILEGVPIPNDDVLNEEVEEILLTEEIERWYKELPVTPYINEFDQIFRKRMIELLAKKLREIERNIDESESLKDMQMKHEVSKFLAQRGKLAQDQDLNINFMVEELSNRLKNKWLKDATGYNQFEKNKPASSTFARVDSADILAPLIEASNTMNRSTRKTNQTNQNPNSNSRSQHLDSDRSLRPDGNMSKPIRPSPRSPSPRQSRSPPPSRNNSGSNQRKNYNERHSSDRPADTPSNSSRSYEKPCNCSQKRASSPHKFRQTSYRNQNNRRDTWQRSTAQNLDKNDKEHLRGRRDSAAYNNSGNIGRHRDESRHEYREESNDPSQVSEGREMSNEENGEVYQECKCMHRFRRKRRYCVNSCLVPNVKSPYTYYC